MITAWSSLAGSRTEAPAVTGRVEPTVVGSLALEASLTVLALERTHLRPTLRKYSRPVVKPRPM